MKIAKTKTAVKFAALALGAAGLVCPAVRAQTSVKSYEIDVPATKEWVDTNIDVHGGAKLRFTATGKITYPADDSYNGKSRTLGTFGPDGLERGFADLLHQYAVNNA